MPPIETSARRPWAVVLAGGDGLRLRSITRDREGRHVPKQFYSFDGDGSLLAQALGRARALTSADHVVVVVQEAHRRWWEPALAGHPRHHVVVQYSNRGTGAAVACAVEYVLERDHDPFLLFLPSDQGVEDELAWRGALRRVAQAAVRWPGEIVVLGLDIPFDPDMGWLIPGPASSDGTRSVVRFVEKPTTFEATLHLDDEGLCSTFVFSASAGALLSLYARHAPLLITGDGSVSGHQGGPGWDATGMTGLPVVDFSHDLLERVPERLRVLTAPGCGWTDLGTPFRLERWRSRRRLAAVETPLASGVGAAAPVHSEAVTASR